MEKAENAEKKKEMKKGKGKNVKMGIWNNGKMEK
jgi:hypothetical protein